MKRTRGGTTWNSLTLESGKAEQPNKYGGHSTQTLKMTDRNPRKLPPLSPKSETGEESDVPRRPRKKKKQPGGVSGPDTDGETPRSGRVRSSSRSRREEDLGQVEAGTPTPAGRKKRPKAQQDEVPADEEFAGQSTTDVRKPRKKKKVSV